MGIYDREYIRGESSGASLFSTSPVTKSIIAANVIIFLLYNLMHWGGDHGVAHQWLMASPEYTFQHYRLHELLTAAFFSFDPLSLFFNMWFLWFIGRDMESIYGSVDFLIFYLASAVLTTLAAVTISHAARGVGGEPPVIFGPWGPILAVMTLFTMYYPRREILLMFIIPMPMWVLLALYILLPLLGRFGSGTPGAGLGLVLTGAGFGYAYKQLDLRWSRLASGRMFRPRLRIFSSVGHDQGTSRPRGPGPSRSSTSVGGARPPSISVLPEDQLDAKVDEILAKIARDGNREGLSDEEQRILQEASRRARIRRSDRI